MRANFTQCKVDWGILQSSDPTRFEHLRWRGLVIGIEANTTHLISAPGCNELCGPGNDWYPWSQASNTITTWVLPVVGIILQAPFVSNAFWETVFSLARWLGSPMASLAYILWNIKVSGKCALLVDLAVPYDRKITSPETNFGSIRDSFYLLMTMNQFTMRPHVRQRKEAEGLLRITLFSKDLRLLRLDKSPEGQMLQSSFDAQPRQFGDTWNPTPSAGEFTPRAEADLEPRGQLNKLRQQLAQDMRNGRKRGVVPVFISTLWFLFALALSIQSAFGYMGDNAQAHDLALGCLLSWLPVLILSSIVDRNPVAADATRRGLNELVDRVRLSLMDDTIRDHFLRSIPDLGQQTEMRKWVANISKECPMLDDFFVLFAGQARKRWHYGAAHPILSDIEGAYIADHGRDWLVNEVEARNKLVLGKPKGLDWLDPRELWQVLSGVVIVGGSVIGAFVLSYYTPTVGLGCRSGGYTVFGSAAFVLLCLEIMAWWIFDASKPSLERFGENVRSMTLAHPSLLSREKTFLTWYARVHMSASRHISNAARRIRRGLSFIISRLVSHKSASAVDQMLKDAWSHWEEMSGQTRLDHVFFKPLELANAAWLIYVMMAQTSGAFRNCDCMSSLWAGEGGYIDWDNYDSVNSLFVALYWTTGAVIASTTMAVAMVYLTLEWILQSHISTASMDDAASGLQWTRRFRWVTSPYRMLIHALIEGAYSIRLRMYKSVRSIFGLGTIETPRAGRRSVRWTREVMQSKTVAGQAVPGARHDEETPSEAEQPLVAGKDFDGEPVVIRVESRGSERSVSISPGASRAPSIEGRSSLQVMGQRAPFERQLSQGSGM